MYDSECACIDRDEDANEDVSTDLQERIKKPESGDDQSGPAASSAHVAEVAESGVRRRRNGNAAGQICKEPKPGGKREKDTQFLHFENCCSSESESAFTRITET